MEKNLKKLNNLLFETIYKGESLQNIATYLKQNSPVSGRSLRQYFFKGLVHLNQRKAHSQALIKPGDHIQVFGFIAEYQGLKPEAMPLAIIYENRDLLVIDKPAQIAVHPSGQIYSGTLANGVAAYFAQNGLKIKVRPVNRLDYGTSGLIIFAKNARAQEVFSVAIQQHRIMRIYYAVVKGKPDSETGLIKLPIKESRGRKRVISQAGQAAETHYRVIDSFKNASLLELSLKTGRTHQIRVHLNHLGHPIIGDRQYGTKSPFLNRPALHAGKLNFAAAGLNIPELTAPLPEDFQMLLEVLKSDPSVSP